MKAIVVLAVYMFASSQLIAKGEQKRSIAPLINGELKLIKFLMPPAYVGEMSEVVGSIFNLTFPFFKHKKNIYALISTPLGVASGRYLLTVSSPQGNIATRNLLVKIRENFKTEELIETTEELVLPKESGIVDSLTREDVQFKSVLKKISPVKYWKNKFIEPVNVPKSSPFGIYRVYSNHIRRRTHWGVDYRASLGTKIKSSSDGVVVLAKNMYFPGKTIIVDHGLGLFTGYCHLEAINVRVGDRVKMGQFIGRSGRTGKVSGAHLHWFAVNGRVKINPLSLLKVNLK